MLEVGSTLRYRGLGAGIVEEHVKRNFAGEVRTFAVLRFPNSDLTAQVPVGDDAVEKKIEPLMAKTRLEKLLRSIPKEGKVLPRTWDAREEMGEEYLSEGGPAEWVVLVASYALAQGSGVSVAASDEEMLRRGQEMLAAELACTTGKEYSWAEEKVLFYYDKAVQQAEKRREEPAEHFAAVKA